MPAVYSTVQHVYNDILSITSVIIMATYPVIGRYH